MNSRTTRLAIKVLPGSSREGIVGWLGDTLRIAVRAPAERGRANKAAIAVLVDALGMSAGSITLVGGRTTQHKLVEILGLSASEVLARVPAKGS